MTGTEKNQDILEKQVEKHLILSIGSNLNSSKGDRFYNIKKAVSLLEPIADDPKDRKMEVKLAFVLDENLL